VTSTCVAVGGTFLLVWIVMRVKTAIVDQPALLAAIVVDEPALLAAAVVQLDKPALLEAAVVQMPDQVVHPPSLYRSASTGDLEEVRALLLEGANVGERGGLKNSTALHAAAFLNHPAVAEFLLDNDADIEATTTDFATPLHHAAFSGHKAVTRVLLARGANLQCKSDNGKTPERHAAAQGHVHTEMMLQDEADRRAEALATEQYAEALAMAEEQ
jgi:hypothetical protein